MSDTTNPKSQKQTKTAGPNPPAPPEPTAIPPLFRKLDWLTAAIAFIAIWTVYFLTMAPELTLEDSGELVTGSVYAGIPHPPGYPVWTIYTWIWTKLIPFGNMAWRVTLGELTAAAFGCGLLALMVSRGSSMLMEGIEELKSMKGKWEAAICMVAGLVASLLVGLDGFMWSESVVINRISLFGMPWLMIVLVCLLRWIYAPTQMRYLYVAMFCFGICATIHQTLVCAAMGIEVAVIFVYPKLGRDMLLGNVICWILGLFAASMHWIGLLDNDMNKLIFNAVGLLSVAGCIWLTISTGGLGSKMLPVLGMAGLWLLGASFYFYMPIAGMSNPPMQWGYPRTVEGFFHALSRGQYEKIAPTDIINDPHRFLAQMGMLVGGIVDEFNLAYVFIALLPFLFILKMQKRERAWIVGLSAIYLCIGVLLMVLLNPNTDRSSAELAQVFFASSHTIVGILVGYGLALTAAFMATNYQRFRRWGLAGGVIAVILALYCLLETTGTLYQGLNGAISLSELPQWIGHALTKDVYGLPVIANLMLVVMGLIFVGAVVVYRNRAPLLITLGIFMIMPLHPGLSHWFDSEQRDHMFGYWFGHDMFTPPFKAADGKPLYPEMTKDAVLFGGTDPGRFCPTYMIFCESFTPHNCQPKEDQKFDRRDVYIITQNALADATYLCYIRAHYNRSKQIDPPFFQELVRTTKEKQLGYKTNLLARAVSPLDTAFTDLGAKIEKQRRTFTSWFEDKDFADFPAFVAKLRPSASQDRVSKWIHDNLSKETQTMLGGQASESSLRSAICKDLNALLERELVSKSEPLYNPTRFSQVKLSRYVTKFIEEKPESSTRVRLNRLLLEEAYPKEIVKSLGGIYPDREIYIPTPEDSQRCFQDYMADAQRRKLMNPPQLKPGENVEIVGDKVQVSGQTAVMSINGLLTKVIFDENPENEFFVEESFPLDWMYPYLTPYGIIMKINRQPLSSVPTDVLQKDHQFWKDYSKRTTGDFIDYNTSVKEVTDWIEKTYLRHDFRGFTGDRKFMRDDDAQKAFSKLRSSIGGIYSWRLNIPGMTPCPPEYRPKNDAETQALMKEANFALLQAFAFCPFSPEAVFRYVNLLLHYNRLDDALLVAQTCAKLDPFNGSVANLVSTLQGFKGQSSGLQQQSSSDANKNAALQRLEQEVQNNPSNLQAAVMLADAYQQMQQPARATQLLDRVLNAASPDPNALIAAVQILVRMSDWPKMELALEKLTTVAPENPEAWYDLSVVRASMGKPADAIKSLATAIDLSSKRLKQDPKAHDLLAAARNEARFAGMRQMPEYQKIVPNSTN